MTNFMMTCRVVLVTLTAVAASSSGLRSREEGHEGQQEISQHRSILVKAPEVQHQLLICNAYASPDKIEIVKVSTREVLTEDNPLDYKQCKDFSMSLQEGEQLDFKAGGLDVGTFFATGLPKTAASLLLIPHRRSPRSVGCTFESHAFADVQSPQIAVIDAYRGKSANKTGSVRIIENNAASGDKASEPVEEELKFNSVVAVNPGLYQIALTGADGKASGGAALNAAGSTKFVVMRLGAEDESQTGGRYPQELVVFPKNGAIRVGFTMLTFIAACVALRDSV